MNTTDIYSAFKPIYWIGKILGSISFSIQGSPKSRKLLCTKSDKIIFIIQTVLLIILTIFFLKNCYEFNLNLKDRSFEITTISMILYADCLIVPIAFIFSAKKKSVICVIWLKIDYFCKYFEKEYYFINYKLIRKYCFIITVTSYLVILTYVVLDCMFFDFSVYANASSVSIFSLLSASISISIETHFALILYVIWSIGTCLNNKIINSRNVSKDSLRNNMNTHYELYELYVNMKSILNFIIIKLFTCFLVLSYSCYAIRIAMIYDKLDFALCVDLFSWSLSHLATVVLVTMCCEACNYEVCS